MVMAALEPNGGASHTPGIVPRYLRDRRRFRNKRARASVLLELVVAMGILTTVMLPIAFSYTLELRTVRAQYFRAVAMEVIDGEMEILLAGEWQTLAQGQHNYSIQ